MLAFQAFGMIDEFMEEFFFSFDLDNVEYMSAWSIQFTGSLISYLECEMINFY